ncbi:(+)-piperitol/(+)-sesamin synthase CYP81Q2-like [Rutidosis leptorrhynchoides]|uniref:(+)-piperitol/(+)-sesamin synthase CYP81Q2-like n=1 Tax=Rutidosis leptorrhynchoides TaxID=125765 RepID=UPI003A9944B0
MSLKFGSRQVVVLSTTPLIEEYLANNDIVFANRPQLPSRQVFNYDKRNLGSLPYGADWRNLRRLTTIEVLSSRRVQLASTTRVGEIRHLVRQLIGNSSDGRKVNMNTFLYLLTVNIMMQSVSGERFIEDGVDSEQVKEKLNHLKHMFGLAGFSNATGDFIPMLRWMPFYKMEKMIRKRFIERDGYMQELIDTRRNAKSYNRVSDSESKRTILDALLVLQESEPEIYTDDFIKGTIMTMILPLPYFQIPLNQHDRIVIRRIASPELMLVAGADTSAKTMEEIISQLLSHPKVLEKARAEIDANVGHSRLMDDSDLSDLPYLQCIMNESLRLKNPIGVSPPHESSEDCTLAGYRIPKGTMLLVNTWLIHRDPSNWEDPETFKPERFELAAEENNSNKGNNSSLKFIPFGFGRRRCPGITLANRLMTLAVGTMIQCFDWEDSGMNSGKNYIDKPLDVVFRPRPELVNVLSQL